jgi:hypothetical protein
VEVLEVDRSRRRKPQTKAEQAGVAYERSNYICEEVRALLEAALIAWREGLPDKVIVQAHDAAIGHQIVCRRIAFGRVDYETAIRAVFDAAEEMGCPFPASMIEQFETNHRVARGEIQGGAIN